jgi:hypothetical protein
MATAKKVFRLKDIVTKEVSIVDRAANLRVFLVTKRSEGKPLERDAQGRLITKSEGEVAPSEESAPPVDPPKSEEPPPSNPEPKPETPKEEPPKEAPSPAKEEPPAGDPPANPPKDEPVKMTEETYKGLVAAIEKLTALASRAEHGDAVKADSDALEPAVLAAIGDLGTVTERKVPVIWEDNVFKCEEGVLKRELKAASKKIAELAEVLAIDTSGTPSPYELRWQICDILDTLVEMTRFEPAEAALAKQNTSRFRALVEGLQKSLDAQLTPPSLDERVEAAEAARLVAAAEGVIKALRAEVVAKGRRIHELESAPGQSNRIPVERSDPERRSEGGWPLDMNAKKYDDEVSFA